MDFKNFIEGRKSNLKKKKADKYMCMSQNLTESYQKAVKKMLSFIEKVSDQDLRLKTVNKSHRLLRDYLGFLCFNQLESAFEC